MDYHREHNAPTAANRFLALSQVGTALMSELDESRLLRLIAQTACDLTGAAFAAFSLRPINDEGQPLVPSEGQFFHLAAVVGITAEQEALFRRMPLGDEGLLAPIFRQGVPVLVSDALLHLTASDPVVNATQAKVSARKTASAYAHGELAASALPSLGVPTGHPTVRSFLGAPLLSRTGEVRGGLLLGHSEPGRFTVEDQTILVSLASQAAVALENARLYRMASLHAQQLDAIFDSISDGVTLVDGQGATVRENRAARHLRASFVATSEGEQILDLLLHAPAQVALSGQREEQTVKVEYTNQQTRTYQVTAQPFHPLSVPSGPLSLNGSGAEAQEIAGAVVVWHDVTEQRARAVERAAATHAKQLEAIFEAMTDAVFVYDRAGNRTLTNTAAHTLISRCLPPEYVERHLSEQFTQIVLTDEHEQPLSLAQWPVSRILDGEVLTPAGAAELSLPTLDGQTLHTHITGSPLQDAEGHPTGALIIVRDMTERKRAERERDQQAKQLRLQARLIDLAHDAIIVRDPAGRVLSWNRGAEELYGWTAELTHGQVVHTLLQTQFPDSQEAVDQILEHEGHWEGLLTQTHQDGKKVIVESRQVRLHDETGEGWTTLGINRDITARVQMEQREHEAREEAEAQQELLQLILDELPISVYLVRGKDARLMLANHRTKALWGASWLYDQPMQAFVTKHQIRLYTPTGHPLGPSQWVTLRAVQQGETVRQYQETIRRPNGSHLPVLVNAVALGTTRRLSRLPTLFADQKTTNVEPLALLVHQDVAALKETEYLKDEFIGIAAHELRNPVAALSGFAQMLISKTAQGRGTPLASWQNEVLEEISLASKRLVTLTEELLDVTRLQAGRLQLQPSNINVVALVQRMVTRLQLTTAHCRLTLQVSSPQLMVFMDQARIEQVLSNLLDNAIKYSPQGGPIEVLVQEQHSTQKVLVSIRDSGIGIPTGEQAQIFSRFKRANNAHKAGITGTGLGLYLCRELIELHGGRIWFESEENVGSTFFLMLPSGKQAKAGTHEERLEYH